MKIRFLVVTVDNPDSAENAAITQANALAARGHDVEVVSILHTADTPRVDVDSNVPVRCLSDHRPGLMSGIRGQGTSESERAELAELPSALVPPHWDPTLNALCDVLLEQHLPRLDADVLVTLTRGLLAAAAQLLPRRCALVHQERLSSMGQPVGRQALLAFAPRADAVVSLTEANACWLRDRLGRLAPPIEVMPEAAPQGQPLSLLDQPVIMAAGRLDEDKQYAHLIRAFSQIADELPDWRVRIYGTGDERRSLMRTIRQFGLYDRVELPGSATDLPAEWAGASIGALTSRQEDFPLALLEAMVAGLPVVSYDCPAGPAELIEDGVTGYLVPAGDVTALAAQLLRLARDHELRARMGQAGLESLGHLDADSVTGGWEEIYSKAVTRRREGHDKVRVREAAAWTENATIGPVAAAGADLMTPAMSRHDLLDRTVRLLAGLDGWFVMPARDEVPPTVVVPGDLRREVLDRLAVADLPAHTSAVVSKGDHWLTRRASVPEMVELLRKSTARGFALEPWPESDGRPNHLAHSSGIRVEFWSQDQNGDLVAPRPNAFASLIAEADIRPDVAVENVVTRGLATLPEPYADQCAFPVDAVYTWVDDADPTWREARARRLAEAGVSQQDRTSSGAARYRNRDELRYSMRSLHLYAPWVRQIYIVTAGQRPEWLQDHPRVKLVDHREILPADALPTFNSHAIEAALHRVPGLSENFVYFNDDVFLARPMGPERFFSPGGLFAVYLAAATVGLGSRGDPPWIMAAHNNRALLLERFGATITHAMAHSPHPHCRSVLDAVSQDFDGAIKATMRAPFRSPHDVSVTSSLAQHYGLLRGDAYIGDIDVAYVNTSLADVQSRLRGLAARDRDVFCLGDYHDYALPEKKVEQLLRDFLERYFPVPGPWEG